MVLIFKKINIKPKIYYLIYKKIKEKKVLIYNTKILIYKKLKILIYKNVNIRNNK